MGDSCWSNLSLTGITALCTTVLESSTPTTIRDKGKPTGKILWEPFVGSKDPVGDKYQVPKVYTASGKVLMGDAQRGQDVWLGNELVAHPEGAPERNKEVTMEEITGKSLQPSQPW